jgi:hypothetical protein
VRIRFLVVMVAAIMVAGGASPALAQPYPGLGFVDEIVEGVLGNVPFETPEECDWYWDEWYGWQYWCWNTYYGWYLSDSCVNQAWQQNNPTGGTNYSYQSCSARG